MLFSRCQILKKQAWIALSTLILQSSQDLFAIAPLKWASAWAGYSLDGPRLRSHLIQGWILQFQGKETKCFCSISPTCPTISKFFALSSLKLTLLEVQWWTMHLWRKMKWIWKWAFDLLYHQWICCLKLASEPSENFDKFAGYASCLICGALKLLHLV